jgi:hypothetical protein
VPGKIFDGMEDVGFDAAHGSAHYLGYFVIFHVVPEAQGQGLLLALGELGEGAAHQRPGLLIQKRRHLVVFHPEGRAGGGYSFVFDVLAIQAAAIQVVYGLPRGDGYQPSPEAGFAPEPRQCPIDAQECFLHNVICVMVVAQD